MRWGATRCAGVCWGAPYYIEGIDTVVFLQRCQFYKLSVIFRGFLCLECDHAMAIVQWRILLRGFFMIVNFEFPLSRMSEALCVLGSLITPTGLHLYATTYPTGESDKAHGVQVKGIANTHARPDQWHAFCVIFNQDCVALSYDGKTGVTCGPNADKWPFDPAFFVASL